MTLLAFLPRHFLVVDSGDVRADLIVVLGGAPDGRAERAAELFRTGAAPRVVVSGFGGDPTWARVLEQNGVPGNAIILEDRSRSTFENAGFCIPILRKLAVRHIIIVTSWYHSRRALACFEHAAPDLVFYSRPSYFGYGIHSWLQQKVGFHMMLEYPKMLRYALMGRVNLGLTSRETSSSGSK